MKTRNMKILIMVASILLVLSLGATTVLGASDTVLKPSDLEGAVVKDETLTNVGKNIIATLQTIGTILAVIILVVLGLKYMMGSAEEKADYKKTMIPYIIGAFCIFIAPTLANIVYSLVTQIA